MIRPPASEIGFAGGVYRQSCSWCHALNVVGSVVRGVPVVSPTACRQCGHRADVPMSRCDCETCTSPQKPLTQAEVDEMLKILHGDQSTGGPDRNAGPRNPEGGAP
jgi:hypothetical protein